MDIEFLSVARQAQNGYFLTVNQSNPDSGTAYLTIHWIVGLGKLIRFPEQLHQ